MTLKELQNLEMQLMIIEKEKFNIDFEDYLKLEKYLEEMDFITKTYLDYFTEYADFLEENNEEEKIKLLTEKNEALLNSNIDIDNVEDVYFLIKKYLKK